MDYIFTKYKQYTTPPETEITDENIRTFVRYYVDKDFTNLPVDLRNKKIGEWNVSRVTDMSYLFFDCKRFNADLNDWKVENVKNMSHMFSGCRNFNSPLYKWKLLDVRKIKGMFTNCSNFNQDISMWKFPKLKHMEFMFFGCDIFNSDLNNWDVSNIESMHQLFYNCHMFNKPLYKWNVSKVEFMGSMFYNCHNFDQDLSNWNIENVKRMDEMFVNCTDLTHNPGWTVDSDTITDDMFAGTRFEKVELKKTPNLKLDNEVKNTIMALSRMRDESGKRINVPSGDVIKNITGYLGPIEKTETGKLDIENQILNARQNEIKKKEYPGGGKRKARRTKKRSNKRVFRKIMHRKTRDRNTRDRK